MTMQQQNARAQALMTDMLAIARRGFSSDHDPAFHAAAAEWGALRRAMVADPGSGFTSDDLARETVMLEEATCEQAAARLVGEGVIKASSMDAVASTLQTRTATPHQAFVAGCLESAIRDQLNGGPTAH